MNKYIIHGGNRLEGDVRISGAKNDVLPILAGAVITAGECVIHNCPDIEDVRLTIEILKNLGCDTHFENSVITVNATNMNSILVPPQLMKKMRSSVIFMGAILARCGEAECSYPGGCEIGSRPINLHLDAFRKLGVDIDEDGDYIKCRLGKYKGGNIVLDFPSVGATENIMMLACRQMEETTIINAAREPEIYDLQCFLNEMGAKISGAGSRVINIQPTGFMHSVERKVIPDRIEAATFMMMAAASGGSLVLGEVEPEHIKSITEVMKSCGADILTDKNKLYINCRKRLKMPVHIETKPYPGFPTDAQSQILSAMVTMEGQGKITENIFENRFNTVPELIKMGADIKAEGKTIEVKGVKRLHAANVSAPDLRGGAALVTAALGAEGVTTVDNICYIDRGYCGFERKITNIGGKIMRG